MRNLQHEFYNYRRKTLVIRKAEKKDYQSVKELEELVFKEYRLARPDYFKNLEDSYTKEEFEKLLSLPCPIAWVAVCEQRIVGLCFGKIYETPENLVCKARKVAYIEDLVTLPEYRSQGVAAKLISKSRKQAIDEGAESLELCVWNFNEKALKLYEKLGMQVQYYRMEEKLRSEPYQ